MHKITLLYIINITNKLIFSQFIFKTQMNGENI